MAGNLSAWQRLLDDDTSNALYKEKVEYYTARQAGLRPTEALGVADKSTFAYRDETSTPSNITLAEGETVVLTGQTETMYRARVGTETVYLPKASVRIRTAQRARTLTRVRARGGASTRSTRRRPERRSTAADDGYHLGPRGGCYTYTSGGNKRYVDRSYCD